MMETRRWWINILKVFKENNWKPKILYPSKYIPKVKQNKELENQKENLLSIDPCQKK